MIWIARLLAAVVALEHFFILILEMFRWNTPGVRKAFGTTAEFADQTRAMAANQGLYNGFLAAGLVFSLGVGSGTFVMFFLACVVVAGLYGGYTVKRSILVVQALPAALALVATALVHL